VQVDKSNNYVYATVGDMTDPWNIEYILRSTNNGDSWSKILSSTNQCAPICVTPNARLFGLDTRENGQIYRTTDDSSFSTVLNVGQSAYCWWIKRDSLTGKIYASFVSTESNPTFARIYVSEDDGENWTVYKTFSVSQPYSGSLGASNFVNGAMYYFVIEDGVWKNNVRLNDVDYAVFWVEIADNLSSVAQTIYVYYGKSDATTTSNVENTFIRVINGAQPVKLALPMNENPDNVTYDRSGKSNHGFISGASLVDGKYGKALSFNGLTDYLRVPDANSLGVSEITIAVWTKRISSKGSFDSICGKDWTNRIFSTTDHISCLLIDANGNAAYIVDPVAMKLNEWYFIVVTYSVAEDTVRLFVNNVQKASSQVLNTPLQVNAADWYIGMRAFDYYPYNGIIDEFNVYNRALTTGEISDLYSNYGYSTTNYAGCVLVRKYVSPEPSHGSWGSEERGEYVMIDKAFVSDERADVRSVQTIGFHAKWNNNGSDVAGGSIYINNTEYMTNSTGWVAFNVNSPFVGKDVWIITGVNCNGVTTYMQTAQAPSIVWDQIKIIEGDTTKESLTLGETATTWFKTIYEYDNTVFTSANGILYLNGSAMTWSATNTRWEYTYTATAIGTATFTISGVYDESYGLTVINDTIGAQTINIWSTPFSVISNSTISELTFNSTSKTLTFIVSGPKGTMGYTNVTIATTLIEDISELKVYVDGNQINSTAVSTDYYWLIHFTYHHSTHRITIVINPMVEHTPTSFLPTHLFLLLAIVTLILVTSFYKRSLIKEKIRRIDIFNFKRLSHSLRP
jgi:hypothetical protein